MKFWKKVYLSINYFFTCIYSNYTSDAVAKAITICHFRELQYKHTVNTPIIHDKLLKVIRKFNLKCGSWDAWCTSEWNTHNHKEKSQLWKSTTINLLLFTKCIIGHLPSKLILTMYDKYTHKSGTLSSPSLSLLSFIISFLALSLPSFSHAYMHTFPTRHWKLRCHLKSITMRTQKLFFVCVITSQWFSLSFTLKGLLPPSITIHYHKIHREFGIHWNLTSTPRFTYWGTLGELFILSVFQWNLSLKR